MASEVSVTPIDQIDRVPARRRSKREKIGSRSTPSLENGAQLTRTEFERRYEAAPEHVRAELIDGVVYMASPTQDPHSTYHMRIAAWFDSYALATPGCEAKVTPTLRLDELDEPEPDALLRIVPEAGGRSRVDTDGYLAGSVELVAEVAASSASRDLHKKKACYLRHDVLEYVVVVVHSKEVLWFAREEGGYVPLSPDRRGVIRSRVFPGLWLDTRALLANDGVRVLATLGRGLASKAHATFARALAARLRSARRRRS